MNCRTGGGIRTPEHPALPATHKPIPRTLVPVGLRSRPGPTEVELERLRAQQPAFVRGVLDERWAAPRLE